MYGFPGILRNMMDSEDIHLLPQTLPFFYKESMRCFPRLDIIVYDEERNLWIKISEDF